MIWDAVNARARGLATHLLRRDELVRVAHSRSLADLSLCLAEAGYRHVGGMSRDPLDVDRAVGYMVAARYRLLARWLGPQAGALAVVLEDEDRHTIRALLRGAAQGVSPGMRLRGVNPTPALGERELERLATAESPTVLAAGLVRAGHPAGRALEAALADPHLTKLGLLGLEAALGRLFALRASRAASRGGPIVGAFAEQVIDLENAWTLLAAGTWGRDVVARDLGLEGGRAIGLKEFERLAGTQDPVRVVAGLRDAFAGTPLAPVFAGDVADSDALERRALQAQLDWLRAESRRNPLSPAVVLGVILRIRMEARNLRALIAGLGLGAPPPVIEAALAGAA